MHCKKSATITLFVTVITLGLGNLPAQTPAPASPDNPLQLTPHHATISVADLDKEEAWYIQVLGFKESSRAKRGEDFEHATLTLGSAYRIDLSWQKGSARHTVGAPSDMEQGWRHIVFTTPSLEKILPILQANKPDMRVDRNAKTNAISQIFIRDPEGNEIELQQP